MIFFKHYLNKTRLIFQSDKRQTAMPANTSDSSGYYHLFLILFPSVKIFKTIFYVSFLLVSAGYGCFPLAKICSRFFSRTSYSVAYSIDSDLGCFVDISRV